MAIMSCFQIHPSREMSVDEFKAWLRQYDMDHDGRFSQEELKEALLSLRTWLAWWKARQGMKVADVNHNGQIDSAKEIEKLVNYAQQRLHIKIYGHVQEQGTGRSLGDRYLAGLHVVHGGQ